VLLTLPLDLRTLSSIETWFVDNLDPVDILHLSRRTPISDHAYIEVSIAPPPCDKVLNLDSINFQHTCQSLRF
jgi:hypothetical protein